VSWFSRSRSAAEPAPAPGGHRSQSLKVLLDSLHSESRHSVLDLGPPLASNIKLLSGLGCRVRIADLHRSLSAESIESRQPEAMGLLLERLLPMAPDERFDALLAWDVLDYLRADQVSSLMARLTPACRPGALALVMVSTRRTIPARPLRYRIVDGDTLDCDGPLQPTRTCPLYTQLDLAHMMPDFAVRRSFLLRNGIQEYLLARDAQGAAKPRSAGAAPGVASERTWFRRGRR
jgi:hypothetical protein